MTYILNFQQVTEFDFNTILRKCGKIDNSYFLDDAEFCITEYANGAMLTTGDYSKELVTCSYS